MRTWTYEKAAVAALVIVAFETIAASALVGNQNVPPPPDLSAFPATIGAWQRSVDIPFPSETAAQLQADRILDRVYVRDQRGIPLELFVAWFKAQQGGAQPHSPKVCLPGSGWLPLAASTMTLPTGAGAIPVNLYTVVNRGRTAEILYWYQTPRRAIANEWTAKFFTLVDGLRDRRTDTAVVRIAVAGGPSSEAAKEAKDFARALYPRLREALPK
jgi:EpsI family protein